MSNNDPKGFSGKKGVKPPPTHITQQLVRKYIHTIAFTIRDILDKIPAAYAMDGGYHLLGWAFVFPLDGENKVHAITIEAIRAIYITDGDTELPNQVTIQRKPVASDTEQSLIKPFTVKQTRVPIDCGIPFGEATSPADDLKAEHSALFQQSLIIPPVLPEVAKELNYDDAELYCQKTVTSDTDVEIPQFDYHQVWVGEVIFSATDLLYMRYLLDEGGYEDVMFSGALIDYNDMMNSKSRIEQFSFSSNRIEGPNKLVPNPSRIFTLKAEPIKNMLPEPGGLSDLTDGEQAKMDGDDSTWQTLNDPMEPAVFLGLPCPTYWEPPNDNQRVAFRTGSSPSQTELNFLRKALSQIIPVGNGQWQQTVAQITLESLKKLHSMNGTMTYKILKPSQTTGSNDQN